MISPVEVTNTETVYLIAPKDEVAEMSGGRSGKGSVIEEEKVKETIIHQAPPPPPPPSSHRATSHHSHHSHHAPTVITVPAPPSEHLEREEVITKTVIEERSVSPSRRSHHHHEGPIIIEGRPRSESATFVERRKSFVERSDPIIIGPLAVQSDRHRSRDERAIRDEIRALEAEKELLRHERRHERRRSGHRRGGRHSDTDLVIYENRVHDDREGDMTIVRKEVRYEEPSGGVKIIKDKRGKMKLSVPKRY